MRNRCRLYRCKKLTQCDSFSGMGYLTFRKYISTHWCIMYVDNPAYTEPLNNTRELLLDLSDHVWVEIYRCYVTTIANGRAKLLIEWIRIIIIEKYTIVQGIVLNWPIQFWRGCLLVPWICKSIDFTKILLTFLVHDLMREAFWTDTIAKSMKSSKMNHSRPLLKFTSRIIAMRNTELNMSSYRKVHRVMERSQPNMPKFLTV